MSLQLTHLPIHALSQQTPSFAGHCPDKHMLGPLQATPFAYFGVQTFGELLLSQKAVAEQSVSPFACEQPVLHLAPPRSHAYGPQDISIGVVQLPLPSHTLCG